MLLQDGSNLVETMDEGLNDEQGGTKATPAALAVLDHLLHEQSEVRALLHAICRSRDGGHWQLSFRTCRGRQHCSVL